MTGDADMEAFRQLPSPVWGTMGIVAMWGGLAFGIYGLHSQNIAVSGWGWAAVGTLAVVFALLTALIVRAVVIRRNLPTENGETRLARPEDLRALTGEALPALDGQLVEATTGHLPSGRRYVACQTSYSVLTRRHVVVGLNGNPRAFEADTTRLGWRLPDGMDPEVARRLMGLRASLFRSARVVDGWLDLTLTPEEGAAASRILNSEASAIELLAATIEAGPAEGAFPAYEGVERR